MAALACIASGGVLLATNGVAAAATGAASAPRHRAQVDEVTITETVTETVPCDPPEPIVTTVEQVVTKTEIKTVTAQSEGAVVLTMSNGKVVGTGVLDASLSREEAVAQAVAAAQAQAGGDTTTTTPGADAAQGDAASSGGNSRSAAAANAAAAQPDELAATGRSTGVLLAVGFVFVLGGLVLLRSSRRDTARLEG